MTTTELIKILQDNEKGGISHRSRRISLTVNGKYLPDPQITLSSTGDGIAGPEIDFDVDGEWLESELCDDAINRQAVLDIINFEDKWLLDAKGHTTNTEIAFSGMKSKVSALPPVKPQEPKTAHWIEENVNEWSRKVFCSKCGCPAPFEHVSTGDVYSASGYGVIHKTKFCPNCGFRMVEPQERSGEE